MIRVALADDHALFVEGIRGLLDEHPDIEVVGTSSDGLAAVELAERLSPEVLVVDLSMPELNGIDVTRMLADRGHSTRTIILSMHRDKRLVLSALRAGASGYLAKDCELSELVGAVRAAAAGHVFLSPEVTASLVGELRDAPGTPDHGLTPREVQVLTMLADGHSTKSIAAILSVSAKTVGSHRENLMRKLNIRSVAGLTKFAVREGLVALDVQV